MQRAQWGCMNARTVGVFPVVGDPERSGSPRRNRSGFWMVWRPSDYPNLGSLFLHLKLCRTCSDCSECHNVSTFVF